VKDDVYIVRNVTIVWNENPETRQAVACYQGNEIVPSAKSCALAGGKYLGRKTNPVAGSMEFVDLVQSANGVFEACPISFLGTHQLGVTEPIELLWKRGPKGIQSHIQILTLSRSLDISVGDDRLIDRLGSKKVVKWGNYHPKDGETIVCQVLWSMGSDGYPIGNAYRIHQTDRKKPKRKSAVLVG